MATLEKAIAIAVEAHRGQLDKAGSTYILHPLRVMFRMETETEMIVAVLHDVIEDSDLDISYLRDEGFTGEVLDAVDALTRRHDESYDEFIDRIKPNPLARRVKLADLEDNMDVKRLPQLTNKIMQSLNRYHRARLSLVGNEHE